MIGSHIVLFRKTIECVTLYCQHSNVLDSARLKQINLWDFNHHHVSNPWREMTLMKLKSADENVERSQSVTWWIMNVINSIWTTSHHVADILQSYTTATSWQICTKKYDMDWKRTLQDIFKYVLFIKHM